VAIVLLSLGAAVYVASPLWIPIVLGLVLAISTHRPYRFLCRRLGGRSSLAAAIITLTTGLAVAVIGAVLLVVLANELMKVVGQLNTRGTHAGSLENLIGERASRAIGELGVDTSRLFTWAQKELEAAATFAASAAAIVVRTTSEAVLGLVVALMTTYYAHREGANLALRIERVAPLEPRHTRMLLNEAREVARTAFVGTIATGLVQGMLAGLGYTALDIPNPVLFAALTAVASFLPVIGTLIVWVPLAGYLFVEGHPIKALILAIYGIIIITSLADYVIRPRIVSGGGDGRQHGHPLLTLIALLGGIEVFGLAGLFIAPIIMSVCVAAFRLYERELRPVSAASSAAT